MTGQKVSGCTSYDASACKLMPISVSMRLDSGNVEGGEPMMTILRFSDVSVMLMLEALVRIGLKYASVVTAKFCLAGNYMVGMTMGNSKGEFGSRSRHGSSGFPPGG